MAHWVRTTDNGGKNIMVNLDRALQLSPRQDGGTDILFGNSFVVIVTSPPDSLVTAKPLGPAELHFVKR